MSVRNLNPNAESMGSKAALHMNIHAAAGLQEVMKTNLGPRGTIKMLVSGAGDIKLTKARAIAFASAVVLPPSLFDHPVLSGRQRAAAGDADSEPDGDYDRPHRGGAGRRHGVR